jgi:hypothetical protein
LKKIQKFLFDSVQRAQCDFRRKFDADWNKTKLSAIFQIWMLVVVKGLSFFSIKTPVGYLDFGFISLQLHACVSQRPVRVDLV